MPDLAGQKIAYIGFTGMIEPGGVGRIAGTMNQAVNEGYDAIHFTFSSNGGYVADGIYLYNHIRALPVHMVAHNTGSVSSIAVAVFLAADERYCSAHSMFMIHPTSMGGAAEGMSAFRLESALQSALADDLRTDNILRERASIPEATLVNRRWTEVHIQPNQAVEFGLVQGVREFALPQGQKLFQI